MNTLILLGVIFGVTTMAVFIAVKWGRSKERKKAAETVARISKLMTEAAVHAPKTKEELLEQINKDGI